MAGVSTVGRFNNNSIDGLMSGTKWTGTVTYSFTQRPNDYGRNYSSYSTNNEPTTDYFALNSDQKKAAGFALDGGFNPAASKAFSVEGFTNLEVSYAGINGDGDLRFGGTSASSTAWAYYPNGTSRGGDVWLGYKDHNSNSYSYAAPKAGNYEWKTILHEVGHALGLKHPHDTRGNFPKLDEKYNAMEYSVMSYNSYLGGDFPGYSNERFSFAQSYMMLDIQALQKLYGADYTTNSGNTVYKWTPTSGNTYINGQVAISPGANRIFMTVWDGGGNDTYDFSAYTNGLRVDLRPGENTKTNDVQIANLGNEDETSNYVYHPSGNVYNALLFNGDTRSLIENAIGGSGNDNINGNQAANKLYGGNGKDSLSGNDGNDFLYGGNDDDRLYGGSGNDFLYGSHGYDRLYGANGNDSLYGGNQNDSLFGIYGNDRLYGGDGLDRLYGGAGNDALSGDNGIDRLYGGDDQDTLYGGNDNDFLYGEKGDDRLYGGNGLDRLYGANGNDSLYGGNQNDSLFGIYGNDRLYGGDGLDRLYGGAGNDALSGDNGIDRLYGGDDQDTLYGGNDNDFLFGDNGNDRLYGSFGRDGLYGGNGNDNLDSGDDNDSLYGGDGVDQLYGGAGDDELQGGTGRDRLYGGDGNDYLNAEASPAFFKVSAINLTQYLDMKGLAVSVTGQDMQNASSNPEGATISAGDLTALNLYSQYNKSISDLVVERYPLSIANETLEPVNFNSIVSIGLKDALWETLLFGTGDILSGGSGHDTLVGSEARDRLYGGADKDILFGGDENDLLYGGSGNDVLGGDDGNDRLNGQIGDDLLTGGAGRDVFVFASGDGFDQITDFNASEDFLSFDSSTGLNIDNFASHFMLVDDDTCIIDYSGGKLALLDFQNVNALGDALLFV